MNNTEYNFVAYIDNMGIVQFQPVYDQNKDMLLKSLTTENRPYFYTAIDHNHAEIEALNYFNKDSVSQSQ